MKEKSTQGVRCQPNRRSFMINSAGMLLAASFIGSKKGFAAASDISSPVHAASNWLLDEWNPHTPFLVWGKPLRVQPILMYATPQPQKESSWRSWGGVLTEESAAEEIDRITRELRAMAEDAEFPLQIYPPVKVKSPEEAERALQSEHDVTLVYPASGSGRLLEACVPKNGDAVLFVRHRSGPLYYWYEALSVAYLKTDQSDAPVRLGDAHVNDVVVDDYGEALWRLRALYGVKNLLGCKIVALGGEWGKYASDAPQIARDKFKMEIINIPYEDVEKRIKSALADPQKMALAEKWTDRYLTLPQTTLKTEKHFVVNAFILYRIFKELMWENQTPLFTIKDCMKTIIPISKTTACLSLGLINDEGLFTLCESDFVVLPAGILLRHISGKPVFMHNSTFPHKAVVTCAHCSAPRRMNSDRYEPTTIMTHEESDFGAAPKVEIPRGQELTFIDPEYTKGRWVGICGNVQDNPFYPICRSQQDVRIQGQWKKLLNEVRDSHWLMVYGDFLKEAGYAARKLGILWDNISDA
ncbi:MAG: sugar isomerase [Candidatus Omnitrophica bacterium]|nr:sugar isomerase [Candidatus Omnitrophota bacterium]